MKSFDDVAQEVTQLPSGLWSRLAFAAACAERLLPFYVCYTKQRGFDPDPYFTALDFAWSCVGAMNCDEFEARHLSMECERTLPNEDDAWKAGCPYAGDATAAILYCLRFILSGDQQDAIWAAKRTYEVADNFVMTHTDYDIDSPDDELKILHHPVVQNELSRQLRDLRELLGADLSAWQRQCCDLRRRAKSDSATFLNLEEATASHS